MVGVGGLVLSREPSSDQHVAVTVQLAMLSGDFKEGLIRAMQQYQTVPSVKARMDILQIDYACCGDSGYKDWFNIAWVSGDSLVADPKEVQA